MPLFLTLYVTTLYTYNVRQNALLGNNCYTRTPFIVQVMFCRSRVSDWTTRATSLRSSILPTNALKYNSETHSCTTFVFLLGTSQKWLKHRDTLVFSLWKVDRIKLSANFSHGMPGAETRLSFRRMLYTNNVMTSGPLFSPKISDSLFSRAKYHFPFFRVWRCH